MVKNGNLNDILMHNFSEIKYKKISKFRETRMVLKNCYITNYPYKSIFYYPVENVPINILCFQIITKATLYKNTLDRKRQHCRLI